MKIKSILQSVALAFIAQAVLATAGTSTPVSGTNLYDVFISGECVSTNNSDGRSSEECHGGMRHILADCAAEHGITNLASLRLIYDRDADAVRVITVTNAIVLCEVMAFDGGQTLSNSNGTSSVRLAFVFLPGDATADGTIKGRVTNHAPKNSRRGWSMRGGFNFSGHFQYATPATATEGASICEGFLSTGVKFEPVITTSGGGNGGGGNGPT